MVMEFCLQVQRLLQASGVSKLKELAEIIEENQNTISNWNSRGRVPEKRIIGLSQIVGCRAEWLEFGIPPMQAGASREETPSYGLDEGLVEMILSAISQYMMDTGKTKTAKEQARLANTIYRELADQHATENDVERMVKVALNFNR